MGIVEAIAAVFGAIKEFFGSFKFFDKWFTNTPTEKVDAAKKKLDEEERKFRETGRPSK